MTSSVSVSPVSGLSSDPIPLDVLIVSETDDEEFAAEQLINQRRAQSENPEALRRARAL